MKIIDSDGNPMLLNDKVSIDNIECIEVRPYYKDGKLYADWYGIAALSDNGAAKVHIPKLSFDITGVVTQTDVEEEVNMYEVRTVTSLTRQCFVTTENSDDEIIIEFKKGKE